MLDALRSLFAKSTPPDAAVSDTAPGAPHDLRIAACALLLEMAHADREFTEAERAHIEEILVRHFAVDAATAQEITRLAERERRAATDLHQFTSVINRHYDEGQRMVLAETLWRVIYADGELSQQEELLARKLANLLELPPGYLAAARRKAQSP
jgi:uncharacterized tellurite resistance protein B-like protein